MQLEPTYLVPENLTPYVNAPLSITTLISTGPLLPMDTGLGFLKVILYAFVAEKTRKI